MKGFKIFNARPIGLLALFVAACFCLPLSMNFGCVERTVSINTEPQGATVFLNDQEVGTSPVKVPFTWYGDYDIIVRKAGYETAQTNRRIEAPWYQWPIIDLFSECLMPFTIRDDRTLDTIVLDNRRPVQKEDLLRNADEMRTQAVGENGPPTPTSTP